MCPQGTKQEGLILAAVLSAVNYVGILAENFITIDLGQKFLTFFVKSSRFRSLKHRTGAMPANLVNYALNYVVNFPQLIM